MNLNFRPKILEKYWTGKSVVVTGASSGLGKAVVEALAPFQINFCMLSRDEEKMLELALRLKDYGSTFFINSCDVRNRESVYDAINKFYKQTGQVDVAWVNSGIAGSTAFQHWDWDTVESLIDTNLKGAIYTIRACLEIMTPQKSGAVVGIGSAVSMRGMPANSIYSMTKIGLEYFLEGLAAEIPDIQFTTIHPGFVDTPINTGNPMRLWLMSPEKAARLMVMAVARRKYVYIYPYRMRLLYRFVRWLPQSVFRPIARSIIKKRQHQKNKQSLNEYS